MPTPKKSANASADAPAKTYYLVTHSMVGGWEQGQVISSDDLAGVDTDRLLRLGAIAPTQEPIKDVLPLDQEADIEQADDAPPVA